jgi:hypothetical protein
MELKAKEGWVEYFLSGVFGLLFLQYLLDFVQPVDQAKPFGPVDILILFVPLLLCIALFIAGSRVVKKTKPEPSSTETK